MDLRVALRLLPFHVNDMGVEVINLFAFFLLAHVLQHVLGELGDGVCLGETDSPKLEFEVSFNIIGACSGIALDNLELFLVVLCLGCNCIGLALEGNGDTVELCIDSIHLCFVVVPTHKLADLFGDGIVLVLDVVDGHEDAHLYFEVLSPADES